MLVFLLGVFAMLWADGAFAKRGPLPGEPRVIRRRNAIEF
jgi:hypothetical protein